MYKYFLTMGNCLSNVRKLRNRLVCFGAFCVICFIKAGRIFKI